MKYLIVIILVACCGCAATNPSPTLIGKSTAETGVNVGDFLWNVMRLAGKW